MQKQQRKRDVRRPSRFDFRRSLSPRARALAVDRRAEEAAKSESTSESPSCIQPEPIASTTNDTEAKTSCASKSNQETQQNADEKVHRSPTSQQHSSNKTGSATTKSGMEQSIQEEQNALRDIRCSSNLGRPLRLCRTFNEKNRKKADNTPRADTRPKKRRIEYKSSSEDESFNERVSSDDEIIQVRCAVKKEKKETKKNEQKPQVPRYNPRQLVCPKCDHELVVMHVERRRVRRRILAAEKKEHLDRLLKMAATLQRVAPTVVQSVKVKNEPKDGGDSDYSIEFVKSTSRKR